jgi:hypothetical protein
MSDQDNTGVVANDEATDVPLIAGYIYLGFLVVATISILMIAGGIWTF